MKEEVFEKKDNTKKNINSIDKAIQEIFKNITGTGKTPPKTPFSFNIQFSKETDDTIQSSLDEKEPNPDMYDDIDSIVVDDKYLYLTLFMPHPQNNLLFDVDEKKGVLAIATQDTSFYKEFHFKIPVNKDTLEVNFNNNVLEIKLELKL